MDKELKLSNEELKLIQIGLGEMVLREKIKEMAAREIINQAKMIIKVIEDIFIESRK